MELNKLAEQEFVRGLKSSNPLITDAEIVSEVQKWWLGKDEHWPEEFFRPASPERIKRLFNDTET